MSAIPRGSWIKLYKDLVRASNEFPQYNYRLFAKRRVRDYFTENKVVADQAKLQELYQEGQSTLKTIRRQAALSSSLPISQQVVDEPRPSSV
uniref:Complex1_LYR_dom domain-containing protein n=1 Tax=Panagrellus redivivus TaxID=6233 RepID=A0A7E4VZK2_PANRE